jgi:hypothetical protein
MESEKLPSSWMFVYINPCFLQHRSNGDIKNVGPRRALMAEEKKQW